MQEMSDREIDAYVEKVCQTALASEIPSGHYRLIIVKLTACKPLAEKFVKRLAMVQVDKRIEVPALWRVARN